VELYREAAQAAADAYHHAKQAAELFEIDPVHPEGFAALSTARAAEQRMKELDEPAASLEVRYRSDPRPEVPRFLDRMATERMFNALVNGGSGRGLGRGRRAASWAPRMALGVDSHCGVAAGKGRRVGPAAVAVCSFGLGWRVTGGRCGGG
jgi:hypothetical protein